MDAVYFLQTETWLLTFLLVGYFLDDIFMSQQIEPEAAKAVIWKCFIFFPPARSLLKKWQVLFVSTALLQLLLHEGLPVQHKMGFGSGKLYWIQLHVSCGTHWAQYSPHPTPHSFPFCVIVRKWLKINTSNCTLMHRILFFLPWHVWLSGLQPLDRMPTCDGIGSSNPMNPKGDWKMDGWTDGSGLQRYILHYIYPSLNKDTAAEKTPTNVSFSSV